ncbi:MAG: DNA-binding protein [Hydrogenophaga sp.]|nr:DNA-binding protein [Hydrogenophaga sp.]
MKAKVLNDAPERTIALILDRGDEVMATLHNFAVEHSLTASRVTAIGAFESATLGYFDWETRTYERIPVNEQVEVLSLVGDIALDGDKPKVHAHVVLGRRDGRAIGGHLLEARVRPTLEVMLIDSPDHLRRECDPVSGIALIRIDG